MYRLHYKVITHAGKIREKNEDNFYVDKIWKKDIEEHSKEAEGYTENDVLLAAVCDGMGGHAKGERASLLAAEQLYTYDHEKLDGQVPMFRFDPMYCVNFINDRICEEKRITNTNMGTTLALLEFSKGQVVAGNLGDSRIYLFRDDHLKQISVDHTLVAGLLRMNIIKEEDAKSHPLNHRITQHLGISKEEMLLDPDVSAPIQLKPSDRFLICSDGLTDMLSDEMIASIIRQERTLNNLAQTLLREALEAGGKDNITLLIVEVEADDTSVHKKRTWKQRFWDFIAGYEAPLQKSKDK